MKRLLIAVAILLSVTACSDDDSKDGQGEVQATYDTIELGEIDQYKEDGYRLVDVRELEEFDSGHIPGALNLPLSGLEQGDFGSLSEEGTYIIICQSGNRSQFASEILSDHGFKLVNVREGMSSWTGEIE